VPLDAIVIRESLRDDLPFLRVMLVEAAYWSTVPRPPIEEALSYPPTARYVEEWGRPGDAGFVAIDGDTGERVGAAWYRRFSVREPGYGFVDEATPEITVAVVASRRGRRIGTALLRALVEQARREGLPALSLSVSPANPAARLYARHGFVRVADADEHWTMLLDLTG
jgi:ribosomal protein S18 acetylase RimI-like enzyme